MILDMSHYRLDQLIQKRNRMIVYNPTRNKNKRAKNIQFFKSESDMNRFLMQYRSVYANIELVDVPEGFAVAWSGRVSEKTRGKMIEV